MKITDEMVERDADKQWYVMFNEGQEPHAVNTPTGEYIEYSVTKYKDGRLYREAHVEADTREDAIEKARAVLTAALGNVEPLESVLPEDWTIDVRYEGAGSSTLWGGGEGKYRAFVGPWDAHASECFEGYGETRDAAVSSAVAAAKGDERACRVCGCTEDNACDGGCWWAEDDLCSACVVDDKQARLELES